MKHQESTKSYFVFLSITRSETTTLCVTLWTCELGKILTIKSPLPKSLPNKMSTPKVTPERFFSSDPNPYPTPEDLPTPDPIPFESKQVPPANSSSKAFGAASALLTGRRQKYNNNGVLLLWTLHWNLAPIHVTTVIVICQFLLPLEFRVLRSAECSGLM
jgi:hypothetical protein